MAMVGRICINAAAAIIAETRPRLLAGSMPILRYVSSLPFDDEVESVPLFCVSFLSRRSGVHDARPNGLVTAADCERTSQLLSDILRVCGRRPLDSHCMFCVCSNGG